MHGMEFGGRGVVVPNFGIRCQERSNTLGLPILFGVASACCDRHGRSNELFLTDRRTSPFAHIARHSCQMTTRWYSATRTRSDSMFQQPVHAAAGCGPGKGGKRCACASAIPTTSSSALTRPCECKESATFTAQQSTSSTYQMSIGLPIVSCKCTVGQLVLWSRSNGGVGASIPALIAWPRSGRKLVVGTLHLTRHRDQLRLQPPRRRRHQYRRYPQHQQDQLQQFHQLLCLQVLRQLLQAVVES